MTFLRRTVALTIACLAAGVFLVALVGFALAAEIARFAKWISE